MKKTTRIALAEETLAIVSSGGYDLGGRWIELAGDLRAAREGAVTHRPEAELGTPPTCESRAGGDSPTKISFGDETTLAGCRRLQGDGAERVAALVFASAKNPGGGFRTGAEAQEEFVARSSALVDAVQASPMYAVHRADSKRCLYTDHVIHAPDVPVFRDDDGALVEAYPVSFLVSPAVNAHQARRKGVGEPTIEATMRRRAERVLSVAVHHGHTDLVLGAWGCGVFKNMVAVVATIFRECLEGPFDDAFDRVRFSVLGRMARPFEDAYRGA